MGATKKLHDRLAMVASLPVLTLLLSAALWGSSWYPFRLLDSQGISGLWAVALTEIAAALFCLLVFGRRLRGFRLGTPLLAIGLLGGACNMGYVIGAIEGEVMRVTLLLYLSPLWTIFLARWLLNEPLNRMGVAVIALSLTGAIVMLWPFGSAGIAFAPGDLWGVMAGLTFAGYNVLVRRHRELSVAHKTLAATAGSAVVALAAMPFVGLTAIPAISNYSWLVIVSLGAFLVLIAILMQHGLERLPAARSSVIMVSELIFATLTAWWWANEVPGTRELAGGALIILASLLSARLMPSHHD